MTRLRIPLRTAMLALSMLPLMGCMAPVFQSGPPAVVDRGCVPGQSCGQTGKGFSFGHSLPGFGRKDCVPLCDTPRELQKISHPTYIVEPPDILLIESVHNIRRADAPLQAADTIILRVQNTLPIDSRDTPVDQAFKQIDGPFVVAADGHIDLGPQYGFIFVAGMTVDRARVEVEENLRRRGLANPRAMLTLVQPEAKQLISGEHLVRPDGTVSLGVYGEVHVAGMTLTEVKHAVERHLAPHVHHPEVSVDVLAYNSKVFYVVSDGGGAGEQVLRFPCTGNTTVLDAIAQAGGLPVVSSRKIWIARPAPAGAGYDQILHVDWDAIVRGGRTETNYQLLPGDRVFIEADHLISFDTYIAKLTAPFERILGFALLGNGTVRAIQNGHRFADGIGGGGGGGGFGF